MNNSSKQSQRDNAHKNLTMQSRNIIFIILIISSTVGSFLYTSLSTALPVIMQDLHTSPTTAQWLTSVYPLAMGIMIPATAFLIKRVKSKKLLIAGLGFYCVGLFICAVSNVFQLLLFGRILQAFGNAITMSMTQVVILTIFPVHQRGSAMGINGLAIGVAPIIAPTLAGVIIDNFDWHLIFWITLILILVDLILAILYMQDVLENEIQSFDMRSMLYSAFGCSGILIGFGNMGMRAFFSLSIALPLIIGIIAITLFIKRQSKLKAPFLDLKTFKNKEFRYSVIMSMLLYVVMYASSTLFPIYIQIVRGYSATVSGLIMMPGAVLMAILSPFAGKIYDKFGIRKLAIVGSAFLSLSCLGVSFVSEYTNLAYIVLCYTMRPIAIGFLMMPLVTWGMSTLTHDYMPHGNALITSLRTIAGAIGVAVFTAVMTLATSLTNQGETIAANAKGIDAAFLGISVFAIIQFIVAVFFIEHSKETNSKKSNERVKMEFNE